jgi:hypothetical protein
MNKNILLSVKTIFKYSKTINIINKLNMEIFLQEKICFLESNLTLNIFIASEIDVNFCYAKPEKSNPIASLNYSNNLAINQLKKTNIVHYLHRMHEETQGYN